MVLCLGMLQSPVISIETTLTFALWHLFNIPAFISACHFHFNFPGMFALCKVIPSFAWDMDRLPHRCCVWLRSECCVFLKHRIRTTCKAKMADHSLAHNIIHFDLERECIIAIAKWFWRRLFQLQRITYPLSPLPLPSPLSPLPSPLYNILLGVYFRTQKENTAHTRPHWL